MHSDQNQISWTRSVQCNYQSYIHIRTSSKPSPFILSNRRMTSSPIMGFVLDFSTINFNCAYSGMAWGWLLTTLVHFHDRDSTISIKYSPQNPTKEPSNSMDCKFCTRQKESLTPGWRARRRVRPTHVGRLCSSIMSVLSKGVSRKHRINSCSVR